MASNPKLDINKEDNIMSQTKAFKGLELHWANLKTPKSPFGTLQWDVQVRTTDADQAAEMAKYGINLKNKDGVYTGNIKRKTVSAKGQALEAPKVVDADDNPVTAMIGNGSVGNVQVFSYDYNVSGRKGTAAMLTKVRITNLVEYSGSSNDEDF